MAEILRDLTGERSGFDESAMKVSLFSVIDKLPPGALNHLNLREIQTRRIGGWRVLLELLSDPTLQEDVASATDAEVASQIVEQLERQLTSLVIKGEGTDPTKEIERCILFRYLERWKGLARP